MTSKQEIPCWETEQKCGSERLSDAKLLESLGNYYIIRFMNTNTRQDRWYDVGQQIRGGAAGTQRGGLLFLLRASLVIITVGIVIMIIISTFILMIIVIIVITYVYTYTYIYIYILPVACC